MIRRLGGLDANSMKNIFNSIFPEFFYLRFKVLKFLSTLVKMLIPIVHLSFAFKVIIVSYLERPTQRDEKTDGHKDKCIKTDR
jgi:hypothetical protein